MNLLEILMLLLDRNIAYGHKLDDSAKLDLTKRIFHQDIVGE